MSRYNTYLNFKNMRDRDSIDFIIKFIAEVEKNPELYNYKLPDYSNRKRIELIWNKIGEKFGETTYDCKSKWKSIRSAYIRTLTSKTKGKDGTDLRKDYYLSGYLQFLKPFAKSCQPREKVRNLTPKQETNTLTEEESSLQISNVETCTDEYLVKEEVQSIDLGSFQSNPGSPTSSEHNYQSSVVKKERINYDENNSIDYFTPKTKRGESFQLESQSREPCELFLLSMVPHVASMSQHQQLTFQKEVLDLIEKIKYPKTPREYCMDSSSAAEFSTHFSQRFQVEPSTSQEENQDL